MVPVSIEVEEGVVFAGHVYDPDGKPVFGATVAPALRLSPFCDTTASISREKLPNADSPTQMCLQSAGIVLASTAVVMTRSIYNCRWATTRWKSRIRLRSPGRFNSPSRQIR